MAVAGYDEPQVRNAAIIADVAHRMGLGDRGALLGVMCAMGESSLRNIDYGDWETNGVRNPDGSPTSSIGLFQQQRWWGSPAERMDARYAAGAFFAALVKVRDWATLPPTLAIHRAQINADPNHYSRYESTARAVLAHIADRRAKGGGLFMAAPVIEWVRDGVGFTPDAAASFRRAEAKWGRIPCNSTYRDWGLQLSMWQAWEAWTQGRGPKPNHSRAVHPDQSRHTSGIALDTNLWTVAGFIAFMADHGWIRTAAWDSTEQHHFEYQWWRDNHRNEPAPAGSNATPIEEDDMYTDEDRKRDARAAKDAAEVKAALLNGSKFDSSKSPLERIEFAAVDTHDRIMVRDENGAVVYDAFQELLNNSRAALTGLSNAEIERLAKAFADESDRRRKTSAA